MRPTRFAFFVILLFASRATAQSVRGSIVGTVTDISHKPVTGATVNLTEQETNRKRSLKTDAQGEFLAPQVPPGVYQLEVEGTGFRKYVQTLTLAVNQELYVDVPLIAGDHVETIVVTATRSMVKT